MSGNIGNTGSGRLTLPAVRGTGSLSLSSPPAPVKPVGAEVTSSGSPLARSSRLNLAVATVATIPGVNRPVQHVRMVPYRFHSRAFMPSWMLERRGLAKQEPVVNALRRLHPAHRTEADEELIAAFDRIKGKVDRVTRRSRGRHNSSTRRAVAGTRVQPARVQPARLTPVVSPNKPAQVPPVQPSIRPVDTTTVKPGATPAQAKPAATGGTPAKSPPAAGGGVSPTVPDRDAQVAAIRQAIPSTARSSFDSIVGMLGRKDLKTGQTLLDHLARFASQGVDARASQAGLTTGQVLGELVMELAHPGLINQSNRGTCAAATAQYYMAINHPAEYARLVTDLMTTGQSTTAGGAVYRRDDGSMRRDDSTRNAVDRVMQSTLMDQSSQGDYDNATDRRANGSGGMSAEDMTAVLRDLTGGTDGNMRTVPGNNSVVIQRIAASTARGIEVPVGLDWSQSGMHAKHALLVTGIENGYVTLRNPWGAGERGTAHNGPARQVISGTGDIRMTLAEFQRRLEVSVLAV